MGCTHREYDIVYCASCAWDFIVNRPQHLALGLARESRVLYVDPTPDSWLGQARRLMQRRPLLGAWRPRLRLIEPNSPGSIPLQVDPRGVKAREPTMAVLAPPAMLPGGSRWEALCSLDNLWLATMIRRALKTLGWRADVLWLSFPWRADLIGRLGERAVAYDCMDRYALLLPQSKRDLAVRLEERILHKAHAVFASAPGFLEECRRHNANSILVPNAADLGHFGSPVQCAAELSSFPRPILGYMGTVGDWFDKDSLRAIAQRRPDWTFVLVGPASVDISQLESLPNVHYLGRRDYAVLPQYLAGFDVCLIPFHINQLTRDVDPVKVYEYFSAGKPVVATRLPSLEAYSELCYLAAEADGLTLAIEQALAERNNRQRAAELRERRLQAASRSTWADRVRIVRATLDTLLEIR